MSRPCNFASASQPRLVSPPRLVSLMSRSQLPYRDPSPDRWIERQLRRIPLPSGLLRRLRRIARLEGGSHAEGDGLTDEQLDARLRNVAVPEGFLLRLQVGAVGETPNWDDAAIDAGLRDVPVPERLLADLRAIADGTATEAATSAVQEAREEPTRDSNQTLAQDEEIAAGLRDVTMPEGLLQRLQAIPGEGRQVPPAPPREPVSRPPRQTSAAPGRTRRRQSDFWRWGSGLALSLALLIGFVYFGSWYLDDPIAERPESDGTGEAVTDADSDTDAGHAIQDGERLLVSEGQQDRPDHGDPNAEGHRAVGEDILRDLPAGGGPAGDTPIVVKSFDPLPELPPLATGDDGPAGDDELAADPANGSVFAGDPRTNIAQLDVAKRRTWRGVRPPWVDADALAAQMRTGFHPFVSPAAHDEFRTRGLPLYAGRTSYDWLRGALPRERLRGRRLTQLRAALARRVRTEDFINAIDYDYPPPRDAALALRSYGGISPFSTPAGEDVDTRLLQIGVQAAAGAGRDPAPVHLVVLVDSSPTMRRNGQLARVRGALDRLLASLGEKDRVTLATTNYQPSTWQPLIASAGRDRIVELRSAVAALDAMPTQDTATALREVEKLSQEAAIEFGDRRAVLWLSDGIAESAEASPARFESLIDELATARRAAVDWSVVDLATDPESDSGLVPLAQAAKAEHEVADDEPEIYWAARSTLAGRSQVVARDAALEITFDPGAVAAYRLLGHEATTVVGSESESLTLTMHASQAATVMIELQLKRRGSDTVAQTKLRWQDPQTREPRQDEQRISRWQFATSFEEAAIPWQAAAVAVASAESLRQSVHTRPEGRQLAAVRNVAQRVQDRVAENASFGELLDLIVRAEAVGL